MNRRSSRIVIIPKGLINPNIVTIVEIPVEYSQEKVVVARIPKDVANVEVPVLNDALFDGNENVYTSALPEEYYSYPEAEADNENAEFDDCNSNEPEKKKCATVRSDQPSHVQNQSVSFNIPRSNVAYILPQSASGEITSKPKPPFHSPFRSEADESFQIKSPQQTSILKPNQSSYQDQTLPPRQNFTLPPRPEATKFASPNLTLPPRQEFGYPLRQEFGPPLSPVQGFRQASSTPVKEFRPPSGQGYRKPSGQDFRPSPGQEFRPPSGQEFRSPLGQEFKPPLGQDFRPPSGQDFGASPGQGFRPSSGQESRSSSGQGFGLVQPREEFNVTTISINRNKTSPNSSPYPATESFNSTKNCATAVSPCKKEACTQRQFNREELIRNISLIEQQEQKKFIEDLERIQNTRRELLLNKSAQLQKVDKTCNKPR